MFFFDKAKWNKVKEGQSPYFCNAVDSLMIPYQINFQKFLVNMDCMQNGHSYSYNYSQGSTFCMIYFAEEISPLELPLGFPDWFYWAFPDVVYWIIKDDGANYMHDKFENLSETELIDSSEGRFRIRILKDIIDLYRSKTGRRLEVSD